MALNPTPDGKTKLPFSFVVASGSTMPPNTRLQHLLLVTILGFATGTDLFSNSFLVRFKKDVDKDEAHRIAQSHGFVSMGPVSDKLR